MFDFPPEIVFQVLNFLVDAHDVIQLSKVCQVAHSLCEEFIQTTYSMTPCLLKFIKKIYSTEPISRKRRKYETTFYYQINCPPLIIYPRLFELAGEFLNCYFQNDCINFAIDWRVNGVYDCRVDKFQTVSKTLYSSTCYDPSSVLGYPKIDSLFVYRIKSCPLFTYYFQPYSEHIPLRFETDAFPIIIKVVDSFPLLHIYVATDFKIFRIFADFVSKSIELYQSDKSFNFYLICWEAQFHKICLEELSFQILDQFSFKNLVVTFDNDVNLKQHIHSHLEDNKN